MSLKNINLSKPFQKIICSAIAVCFSMLAFPSASAAEPATAVPSANEISSKILSVWALFNAEATESTFSYAATDEMGIGNAIYAYRTTANGLRLCDCSYYPIFSGGTIVGISDYIFDTNGNFGVGTSFAPELEQYRLNTSGERPVALIYDGGKLYIYDGVHLEILKEYWSDLTEYGNVSEQIAASEISLVDLKKTSIVENTVPNACRATSSYTLDIPKKLQGDKNLCWAAVTASIGQYKTGTNYTPGELAKKYGVNENAGLEPQFVPQCFKNFYNMNATFYSNAPSPTTLMNEIQNGDPVYLSAIHHEGGVSSSAHAIGLRGYGSGGSSAVNWFYLDPNVGFCTVYSQSATITFSSLGVSYTVARYVTV